MISNNSEYIGIVNDKITLNCIVTNIVPTKKNNSIMIIFLEDTFNNKLISFVDTSKSNILGKVIYTYKDTITNKKYKSNHPIWNELYYIRISNGDVERDYININNSDLYEEYHSFIDKLMDDKDSFPMYGNYVSKINNQIYNLETIMDKYEYDISKNDKIKVTIKILNHSLNRGVKQTTCKIMKYSKNG